MSSQNGGTYVKNMLDWTSDDVIEEKIIEKVVTENQDQWLIDHSEIVNFFDGANVLITGGSGFLGKLLVEKLLRTCTKIQTMYLVMRAKKGKTPEQRFKEHFEDSLYDRLKVEQPDFAKKVMMIEGQMEGKNLGLSPENREMLKNAHIVFHGAATVRFDEKLRTAVNINVRGTKETILFAREMPNLKAFVHIGTAFSQCVTNVIEEVFYPPPLDADKLLYLVDILDDKQLEILTPELVGNWPNTYAFTKAAAEDVVRKYCTGIPTCVVRPSIMIATAKEPSPGWINNFYGPTGVVVGAGIGLLRTLHCNSEYVADIIPADYVINNLIAAAWDVAQTQKLDMNRSLEPRPNTPNAPDDPPIFNSVSSCQNPVTWGEFMKCNEEHGREIPTSRVMWHYMFSLNKNYWVHNFYIIMLHLLPAVIVDSLAVLTGHKPQLWSAYKKIHKFSDVISYFCTQQWSFCNNRVMRLWDKLSPVDRQLFDFNLSSLSWKEYFYYHIRGCRIYIIKDPMDTVSRAVVRKQRFLIAHYTLLTLGYLFLFWLASLFVRYILSIWF